MKKKNNYLLYVGILAVLVCVVFIISLLMRNGDTKQTESESENNAGMQQVQTQTTYEISKDISYSYDTETQTVTLLSESFTNSAENERLIQYSVCIKESGELLYEAEPLQPGASLDSISFLFDAQPGEYELYLISASLDPTTMEEKNSVMTLLTLIIP